ncbi:MAG: MFS transporter [Paracoccus aminovorans]|nr:MFS transporter [Paracoccus aminovorans]
MPASTPHATAGVAFALGLIMLIGPASIDMYLPFIPAIAAELHSSYAAVQWSLTVFLLAMGGGQLVFGPVIDAFGRRMPLLAALAAFVLASGLAAAAPGLDALVLARLLQGLAASLAIVTAMSTVRDVAEGVRAAQIFALLMTIQGIGPVLAPAVGGLIGSGFGWRAVFVALALLGVVVLAVAFALLSETLPRHRRTTLRPAEVMRGYGAILSDGRFVLPGLALSAVFVFLFSYIGGAAEAYQGSFGVSARSFGFIFGATGLAVLLGAMASARLVAGVPVQRLALAGVLAILAGTGLALLTSLAGLGLPWIVAGMFIALAGLGLAETMLTSIALATRSTALGASAALLGAGSLLLGALATPLAAVAIQAGVLPWLGFLTISALAATGLTLASTRMVARSGLAVGLHQ